MKNPVILNLWPEGSAHSTLVTGQWLPRIEVYLPAAAARRPVAAMLILPGGGYGGLAAHEAEPVAELFTRHGMAGIVVRYRVAPCRYPAPVADACRAMRLVRQNAARFGIDPQRVGLLGFSAGGHLAATIGTQPELHREPADDLCAQWSARPDRLVLVYPVISFVAEFHEGSMLNLLGEKPAMAMRERLSHEKHVGPGNPPTFLFHTADDGGVPASNAVRYADACLHAGVPVELHVFAHGRHGVGLASDDPALKPWTELLMLWLREWTHPPA